MEPLKHSEKSGKVTEGTENQRKNWNCQENSIAEIHKNTEKKLGKPSKLAVTWTSMKTTIREKVFKEYNNNNNNNNEDNVVTKMKRSII